MACDLSGKKAYRLPGPSKSEESDLSLIISCLSRLVFFSLLSIYPSTMKFSLIAASLLVGSASAWSSMTMKAGKLFLFVLLGYQKSIVHICLCQGAFVRDSTSFAIVILGLTLMSEFSCVLCRTESMNLYRICRWCSQPS